MTAGVQVLDVRSKMIGVLVRAARLKAGKTIKQCAQWIGCSSHVMSQYEYGRRTISLPELELLAKLFQVSVRHLLDDEAVDLETPDELPPADEAMRLRHKEIGVLLRQVRLAAGQTQRECARELGVSPETFSKYERGHKAMPITHLETMADLFGVSISDFLERELYDSEALGEADESSLLPTQQAWDNLPADIKAFIRHPDSLPYLQMAARVHELPRDSLKRVAEAVLSSEGADERPSS